MATAARDCARGGSSTASLTRTGSRGSRVPKYTASPTTSKVAMTQTERRKAVPMRRSSASTSSASGSGVGRSPIAGRPHELDRGTEDRPNVAGITGLAPKIVDHYRFGCVVRGRVAYAMQGDRGVARVVVWLVARVQRPVLLGARFVAEQGTDERQVVMRGQILYIESQRLCEPAGCFAKQGIAPPILCALELCALEERLAELIQRAVVLAEVEFACARVGEIRVDHIAEITDRIVELAVLLVDQAGKPGDRPGVGWYRGLCRPLERSCRLVEAPLAQADAR